MGTLPNPFARDIAEAGARDCGSAYVASRELHYLAGVGALDYLRRAADAFGVDVPAETVALVSKAARAKASALGAFDGYARAEALALDALTATSADHGTAIARRLVADLSRCTAIRAALLGKGQAVPGRGVWLVPAT